MYGKKKVVVFFERTKNDKRVFVEKFKEDL